MMLENFIYKCTDCETVKATNEDLGESTWLLSCCSIRCQGMVKEHFRLDFTYNYVIGKERNVSIICEKEDISDDSEEDNTATIDVDRSVNK